MKKHKKTLKRLQKIDISLNCKICGKSTKSNAGLSSHIRRKHNMSYEKYVLTYYNIDIIKLNEEYIQHKLEHKDEILKAQVSGLNTYAKQNKGKTKKDILSDEQYEQFIKSMQGVFTLEWFIKKYGKSEGEVKYKERSNQISKTIYWKKCNTTSQNWSKISQELFFKIYDIIKNQFNNIYFGELNHEYSCGINACHYDFVIADTKKIIEFNGDKFHANPALYESSDIPLSFINKTAAEIWKHDKEKNQKALNNGYELKIVWESDYLKNKDKVVLDCIKYILS